jgi:hypothetical protein
MVEPNVDVDNVNVAVNFQGGFLSGVVDYINGLKSSLLEGDDEVLTSAMVVVVFVSAGVFLWRRL